jgi:tRNA (guanine37-N1)-methyltransferase
MRIDILTIFPEMCRAPLAESIMKRACENGLVELRIHDLRNWAVGKHRIVDDEPFGGGPGMVMKPEPFFRAVEELRTLEAKVLLLTPQGERLRQSMVKELSTESHLIVLCGHYEGVDHRVVEHLVDREISIGDYVLTNGAIAANVLVDAVVRLIPGVLGDPGSAEEESFSQPHLLEGPHYTRPAEFRGMKVPEILLSGHHEKIRAWRAEQGLERTRRNRPDLLDSQLNANSERSGEE